VSSDHVTVVGAVIVTGGRVFAARRAYPADLAGFWEFPGGKVEPGEDPQSALVREIREEFDATIFVVDEVIGDVPWVISEKYTLRLYRAILTNGNLQPGIDHDDVRWLSITELDTMNWLPTDHAALVAVKRVVQLVSDQR